MSSLRAFKHKLSTVSRRWAKEDYDGAVAEVEVMLKTWPGNSHLRVLWASLVQLQENPTHNLDDVKQALEHAADLDKGSPAAMIELAHFLDNVEDDPNAASKVYADGVAVARQLLIDGLIGQAKVFRQLDKWDEFHRCLQEIIYLVGHSDGSGRHRSASGSRRSQFEIDPKIQDLINDMNTGRLP